GGAVPDGACRGAAVAPRGPAGALPARAPPRWDGEAADALSPEHRRGPSPRRVVVHEPGAPRLARAAARGDPRHAPRAGRAPARGEHGALVALAARARLAARPRERAAAAAHAAGARQPGRTSDPALRRVAARPRDHAALHPARRLVAEHDGVRAAHPDPPRPRGDPPGVRRRHYRPVGSDGRGLERGAHPIRVGRPARRPPATCTRPAPPARRLRRVHPPPRTSRAPNGARGMATLNPSDPL
ncbi:MAG: hypothetical protein AVDCRST_MAG40-1647, partial [uncultured Gemmatimonadaceae bacterium]